MQNKIGVLLPQSNQHPRIGKSFMRGLRLAMVDTDAQLLIESIGFGADIKQIINAQQKLSFQEDVLLTTGLFGHYQFADLANFVSGNGETLIAATMGATETITLPKGVFVNSLGLRNSLKSLVIYLNEKGVKTIATSACYYEAGYGFISALEEALNEYDNMTFAGHYITPLHPREDEAQIMLETFQECQPDAIIGFHNGVYAEEHASFLAENGVAELFPYYCLPFSFDENTVEKYPGVASKVKLVSNWFPELIATENEKFITQYTKAHGQKPDFFALLGYENGLIIAEAITEGNNISETIHRSNINGPRGPVYFQEGETRFEYTLWEQKPNSNNIRNKIKSFPIPPQNKTVDSIGSQGWYNAYLCH